MWRSSIEERASKVAAVSPELVLPSLPLPLSATMPPSVARALLCASALALMANGFRTLVALVSSGQSTRERQGEPLFTSRLQRKPATGCSRREEVSFSSLPSAGTSSVLSPYISQLLTSLQPRGRIAHYRTRIRARSRTSLSEYALIPC